MIVAGHLALCAGLSELHPNMDDTLFFWVGQVLALGAQKLMFIFRTFWPNVMGVVKGTRKVFSLRSLS